MYYVMRASAPSLHRESTDSLISFVDSRHNCIYLCMDLSLIHNISCLNDLIGLLTYLIAFFEVVIRR